MRQIALVAALGLVLAVTGTAGAISLQFNHPYSGPVLANINDYDAGRVYVPFFESVGQVVTLSSSDLNDLRNAPLIGGIRMTTKGFTIDGPGCVEGEDAWGVFRVTAINGFDGTSFADTLYNISQPGPDLVGMFSGIRDMQVKATLISAGADATVGTPDDMIEMETWADGAIHVDIYEVPNGSAVLSAPTARTGQFTFPNFTGAVGDLWVTGDAIVNTNPTWPAGSEYHSKVLINGSGVVISSLLNGTDGTAGMVFDVSDSVGYGAFLGTNSDVNLDADLAFTAHVTGDLTGMGWTTNTFDPAMGFATPEPLTMLGVFLGVGGLARYIRRRAA